MQTIQLYVEEYKGEERIFIRSEYDKLLNCLLQQMPGLKWSRTKKQWHMPMNENIYRQFDGAAKKLVSIDNSSVRDYLHNKRRVIKPAVKVLADVVIEKINSRPDIAGINKHVLPAMRQALVLKAYSPSTIKTYLNEAAQFLQALKTNAADEFGTDRIKGYLQYCFETLKLSENSLHSRINALKFYYEQVLKREKFFWDIPRPKKPLLLPRFFNQDEIAAIINHTKNIKHKAMLMLCYSTGLRVSEVVSLKTCNIDSKCMSILVERAKGKKDRMVPLSPVLLVMLRQYVREFNPLQKGFLFEGATRTAPYAARSLQQVLQAAKQKANIIKPGGVHALRHSFATHLLDKGTGISMIQKLLGHNDIKTTLRYLHTSNRDILNIISPLDSLQLKDQ